MGNEILIRFVLVTQITLMIAVFPGISSQIRQTLVKKWTFFKEQRVFGKSRLPGEKLRNYWEIDMKKFK